MILILLSTFLISIIFYYLIFKYKLYPKIFLDLPDKIRKKHTSPVPKLGVIFFIPFFVLFDYSNLNFEHTFHLYIFCLIFIMIGIIDDIFSNKWSMRLFYETVFILSYLLLNKDLLLTELNFNEFHLKNLIYENFYLSLFFTTFCFIAIVNALNFYDGINNQLSNYLIILFIFFLLKQAIIYFLF